jgi:hypothetical protein
VGSRGVQPALRGCAVFETCFLPGLRTSLSIPEIRAVGPTLVTSREPDLGSRQAVRPGVGIGFTPCCNSQQRKGSTRTYRVRPPHAAGRYNPHGNWDLICARRPRACQDRISRLRCKEIPQSLASIIYPRIDAKHLVVRISCSSRQQQPLPALLSICNFVGKSSSQRQT